MLLFFHPAAGDAARHAALALERAGILSERWTCLPEKNAAPAFSPDTRTPPHFIAPPVRSRNFIAACRSLDRTVSGRLSAHPFRAVYAHECSAERSFRVAGLRGVLRIYGMVGGHWRAGQMLREEEAELSPEWISTWLPPSATSRHKAQQDAELCQADLIVVESSFALRTLDFVPGLAAAIAILPPGTLAPAQRIAPRMPEAGAPLRVLFAGELSQSHGLSYLFEAGRELGPRVSLTIAGTRPAPSCRALEDALGAVRYRPELTDAELATEISGHDVLVTPSLFEFSDSLIPRAMASGLPVIATPHTLAPELITDGVEGFVVPIRSSDAIAQRLDALCRDVALREEMSLAARLRARKSSWENYEHALAASVAIALGRR